MTATGTLVAESLGLGTEVTTPLTIRRLTRIGAWSRDGDQPAHWTLIDFTCPDENADRLAAELASALLPDRWYTDFATETTKYVVFAGTTYRFARGDSEGNAQAVAHARQIGVPEAQLDWSRERAFRSGGGPPAVSGAGGGPQCDGPTQPRAPAAQLAPGGRPQVARADRGDHTRI